MKPPRKQYGRRAKGQTQACISILTVVYDKGVAEAEKRDISFSELVEELVKADKGEGK